MSNNTMSVTSSGTMAILDSVFVEVQSMEREAHRILLSCQATDSESKVLLNSLLNVEKPKKIAFVVQNQANWVTVSSGKQRLNKGLTYWDFELNLVRRYPSHYSEIATKELSVEDIILFRGRLLLLDEQPDVRGDVFAETLIRAPGGGMEPIESSPLLDFLGNRKVDRLQLEELRLFMVWLLWSYRVVETITELKIEYLSDDKLFISLEGKRSCQYDDTQPETLEIEGELRVEHG